MRHAIVVDDERAALRWFERTAAACPELIIDGAFQGAEEALAFVRENTVDVAFLDIEMPEMSGLELAERLMDIDPYIKVVFVTAYNQYALDAFRAHAIGYLLKPLDSNDLAEQLRLLNGWHRQPPAQDIPQRLQVTCFGQFAVSSNDGVHIRWKTAKAEELFALLIHHQGRSKSRDILIDALWPNIDPDKALNLFRVTCTYLRTALAELGFQKLILRELNEYRINIDNIDCDLYYFRATAHSVAQKCLDDLESAAALYIGEYMEDKSFDWIINARTQTESEYKKVQHLIANEYVRIGMPDKACDAMDGILQHDPCDEGAAVRAILLRLENDKPAEAMQTFRRYENSLQNELGIEPSSKFNRLFGK